MVNTSKAQYRFRLVLALPLVVVCFTLAAGFLPLGMFDVNLSRVKSINELRPVILNLKIVVLFITILAAAVAIGISLYIVRPLERMIGQMLEMADANDQHLPEKRTNDEIDRLAQLYNQTFVPMKGYLTTADLFLQMSEGILSLDAEGKVAFLNAPVERLLAIDRRQYMGHHYKKVFPDSARNAEIHELIRDVIHHGLVRTRDVLVSTPSGRDVYVRATASPATGKKNEAIGVVMLFQDIEELGRLRDQLRRMDVLASIGGTITGMAHEVKTPLGYIRGLAELMKEDLPEGAKHQTYAKTIIEAVDRLNLMVQDILSLASVKVDKSETFDPVTALREAILYVRQLTTSRELKVVEDFPANPSSIKADRQKLLESFINILKNACEASPRGATLSVRYREVAIGHTSGEAESTVMIDFHNEGSYISPETREKLFTPFFTTKKQGTGLGLAICKQIIEAHGGAIHIESDSETGTLFRILLPTSPGVPASSATTT
jgi:PAS domain S-box-containing protein